MTAAWIFDREQEREALADRLARRNSLLVHGPSGIGKTLLVVSAIRERPAFLYSPDSATIHGVFRNLATQLWRQRAPRVQASAGRAGLDGLKTKSTANLKGVVFDALREGQYCIVLDHVKRPSYAFAAAIREMMSWCRTPIITLARSAHMEDTGFLLPFYPDRSDKFALKPFDDDTAERFARHMAERAGVVAENLADVIERIVEYSAGNPGAIVSMVAMAKLSKYRSQERIKIAPLYIDFRLNWS